MAVYTTDDLVPYISGDDVDIGHRTFLFRVATRILDDLGISHSLHTIDPENLQIDGDFYVDPNG